MKNSIYFSDEENDHKNQLNKSVDSNAETQAIDNLPVENQLELIKEYEKKITALYHQTPLKYVIYIKPIKYDQETNHDNQSQRSQGSNCRKENKQEYTLIQAKNSYNTQKEFIENNFKIPKLMQQAQKTKFRCLSFKKMRRTNGPHSSFYFSQNSKSDTIQSEVKQEKQLYFSDAQGTQEAQNPQKQQIEKKSFYCKIQQSFIPEVQKDNGKYIVNRHNLSKIYEYISIQLQLAKYHTQSNQDPFYEKVFNEAVSDLSYKASTERSSHLLSKGRHFIVRRIMEVFANIPPKQRQEERFVRNRLTIKQRDMMIRASLPIPPPRLTTQFLASLFQNKNFRIFFKDFIYKGNLEQVLMDRSNIQIRKYDNYYKKIGSMKQSLQQKLVKLRRDPAPLSWLQVRLFMQQAYAINDKYCNDL